MNSVAGRIARANRCFMIKAHVLYHKVHVVYICILNEYAAVNITVSTSLHATYFDWTIISWIINDIIYIYLYRPRTQALNSASWPAPSKELGHEVDEYRFRCWVHIFNLTRPDRGLIWFYRLHNFWRVYIIIYNSTIELWMHEVACRLCIIILNASAYQA